MRVFVAAFLACLLVLALHGARLREALTQPCYALPKYVDSYVATLQKLPLLAHIVPGMGAGGTHALDHNFRFGPMDSAVVTFDMHPDLGFEWGTCTGKIGGFLVGPAKAAAHRHSPDGSSFRVLWSDNGSAEGYVYIPAGTESLNQGLGPGSSGGAKLFKDQLVRAFKEGAWNRVAIGMKLNSFDGSGRPVQDGILMLSVNCKTFLHTNVVMRTRPEYKIDSFSFNVFHGGRGCKATRTSTLRFRDVKLYTWRDGWGRPARPGRL